MNALPNSRASTADWLWPAVFLALWLAGAAALRMPFCLEPGRFLYGSDALLLSTSALTGSGLTSTALSGQFTTYGLFILALLMQAGFIATLCISGRLARGLFPLFTHNRQPLSREITQTGMKVILAGQALLLALWLIWPQTGPTTFIAYDNLVSGIFNAIGAASTTGWTLNPTGFLGTQFTGIGQAAFLPLFLLPALGVVPVGDAWRWAVTAGRHTVHPVSRKIWSAFAVTFIAGVLLITLSILVPYSYQLLHLGMESNASSTTGITAGIAQNAFMTGTFAAGPARLSGAQPIEPGQALPGYQFIMLALSFIGLAPLSLAAGVNVLSLSTLAQSAFSAWRGNPSPSCQPTSRLTQWALATLVFYISLTAAGLFLLLLSEPYPAITLAAEVISAASCAGFSLGITSDLTSMGKCVLIALMVLGRLGPLYLAARFITARPPAQTPESPDQTR